MLKIITDECNLHQSHISKILDPDQFRAGVYLNCLIGILYLRHFPHWLLEKKHSSNPSNKCTSAFNHWSQFDIALFNLLLADFKRQPIEILRLSFFVSGPMYAFGPGSSDSSL